VNRRLAITLPAAMLALTTLLPAQGRFGARPAPAARTGMGARPVLTGPSLREGRRVFGRSRFGTYPYFYSDLYWPYLFPPFPDYDSDYESEPAVGEAAPAPPQVVVVQAPVSGAASVARPPAEPLLLELQGDEWVRITNSGQSRAGVQPASQGSANAGAGAAPRRVIPEEKPQELPPTVLVFRDGHKEQVKRYTIIGNTLSVSADYWSTGSWTKEVRISELDLPATVKLNQDRGVKFALPSGPREIVVRP
jgi:hypothetical protein